MLNNLYVIQQLTPQEGGYRAEVTLNPHHPIYQGHFPGHPITPGVCLLEIIRSCAEAALGYPMLLTDIKSCKFTAPIIPKEGEVLSLRFSFEERRLRCTALWQGQTALKFDGVFTPTTH